MLTRLLNWFGAHDPADTGAWAERIAAEWLQRERGFRVLARNWRNPRDLREEIDLVCHDGDVLVFVEVKARAAGALVRGYFAVNRRKRHVLLCATKAYLRGLRPRPRTYRLDVVEIAVETRTADGRRADVRHFENVPLFSKHDR